MPPTQTSISIADAVENLRTQILEAIERGNDAEGIKFGLSEVEVELQLVAEQKVGLGVKGGWSFAVFSGDVSADAETTKAQTHTIRFKLTVEDAKTGQGGILMSDG
ncbi:MAG: hypothetical protein KKB02_03135 [Alphaproteobacteria bacterium]|nr:hypothetical protein [Alphaproteobacteria bacterium]